MPIGDRSILEIVIAQLARSRITEVTLCVGYLSHLIEAVLGDGAASGVQISYVREPEALGTAAPLRLIENLDETFLLMNGDVLTSLDHRDLIRYHRDQENILTIAVKERPIAVDYGVLKLGKRDSRTRVRAYEEKPQITTAVSMGIYVVEPRALAYIPAHGYFDFPELVQALLRAGEPVGAYLHDGMWFDIGLPEDHARAVDAWEASGETELEGRRLDAVHTVG
jgi:NDP-sugar pyrophosphorylase family protein